jgi:RHS repeat-associated protein
VDERFTRTDAGGTRNFLTDALGSAIALADSAGTIQTEYTYDAFGKMTFTGSSNSNPYQYTGRENDGTGLYYYRARYYHPELQRFISEDPIGFSGGGANFYPYVNNNSINFSDPLGLFVPTVHNRITRNAAAQPVVLNLQVRWPEWLHWSTSNLRVKPPIMLTGMECVHQKTQMTRQRVNSSLITTFRIDSRNASLTVSPTPCTLLKIGLQKGIVAAGHGTVLGELQSPTPFRTCTKIHGRGLLLKRLRKQKANV